MHRHWHFEALGWACLTDAFLHRYHLGSRRIDGFRICTLHLDVLAATALLRSEQVLHSTNPESSTFSFSDIDPSDGSRVPSVISGAPDPQGYDVASTSTLFPHGLTPMPQAGQHWTNPPNASVQPVAWWNTPYSQGVNNGSALPYRHASHNNSFGYQDNSQSGLAMDGHSGLHSRVANQSSPYHLAAGGPATQPTNYSQYSSQVQNAHGHRPPGHQGDTHFRTGQINLQNPGAPRSTRGSGPYNGNNSY